MYKTEDSIVKDIKIFSDAIRQSFKVRKVFLFGSFAKGTATFESDIDVGVVIEGLENMDEIKVLGQLFKKTIPINTRIEPWCISYKEFKNPLPSSILAAIKKSAIMIYEK